MSTRQIIMAMMSLIVVSGFLSSAAQVDMAGQGGVLDVSGNVRDAQGTHRALLVGINAYAPEYDPGPLPSCINDALGVRNTILLADPGQRWSASLIQVLTNNFATRAAIRTTLQSLATASQPGDLALYAHSSHGGQYSGTSVFLCAYDADYSAVSLGQDLALFNPGVTVIVLVDACHSGGLFKQKDGWPFAEMTMKSYTETLTKQYQSKGLAVPKVPGTNIAFMTACDYSQTCQAGDPYSLYIGTVITGCLDSAVDVNKDGLYQFSELHTYAARLATQQNPGQTAQLFNEAVLTSMVARSVGSIVVTNTVVNDYDGDHKSDLAAYNAGYWSIYSLVNGIIAINAGEWGGANATPVPGDYDGDGKADLAFYRDGYWSIYSLVNGLILINGGEWGGANATPVPGDYDGDGKADLAFYRDGYWSIYSLANGLILFEGGEWGGANATPVPGDYDGDGKSDLAFYRDGYWSIYSLANGIILLNGEWGGADCTPVPGDYDGDGKSDLAFYRSGYWSIYSLVNGLILNNEGPWGGTGWTPVLQNSWGMR
ncbi:MAG: FG-GAP-like repeat-containing protein [Verrucomicrobiota bacterium]